MDERTFIHEGEQGYNAIHINALYDLNNHTYCDFIVQGKKKLHERAALISMIDRYSDPTPAILMADRGYESFNVFAHLIRKGMKFVIRIKDINSNGILSSYDFPDDEFDTNITTTLIRRHTKETLSKPDVYTILQPCTDFDFLDDECKYYDITLRIVRIKVSDDKYICIATNLSEVVKTKEDTKHVYKINFVTAVNICRSYLKNGGDEIEIMRLIQRHLTPIRANRKYSIKLRPKRNRDFMYRAA